MSSWNPVLVLAGPLTHIHSHSCPEATPGIQAECLKLVVLLRAWPSSGAGFRILPGCCCWKTSSQPSEAPLCFKRWPGDERLSGLLQLWCNSAFVSPDKLCFSWPVKPPGKLDGGSLSPLDFLRSMGRRKNWVVRAHGHETMCFPQICWGLLMCCRLWLTQFLAKSKMALTSGLVLYSTLL